MRTTAFAYWAVLLVSGIVAVFSATPVRAEEQILSLQQVVEYSLQNNGDLTSFREEKGIRDAGTVRAGLLPNPTLDFEAGTGALTGSSSESSLAIGISQEFFLAGKRGKRLTVAEREQDIYRWQLADRERLTREAVKTVFYDVVLSLQRFVLAERAIALNGQLLDVTRERLAAGDIPELEMNLAKVELARSESVKIDVAKALNQNQAKLLALAGLTLGKQYVVSGEFGSAITQKPTLLELKRLASERRPDVMALAAENARGDADVVLAQAENIPNLTAGLVVRRDTTAMEIGGVEGKDTAYTIGVKLSLPIPLFDKNQAGVQEAKARRSSSASRLTAAVRDVERDVETAYAGYLNCEQVIALYTTNIIPQLEENLKLTQEAYRLGEVGILSVIQEQKKYFDVSDGYLMALYDRQIAVVKLESAVATEFTGGVK